MSLLPFKYLRLRSVLALALLVTLSSTLFSTTAFTLVGYYRGFNIYLGEGEDIVAVYDRGSRTPFTGIVPAYLTEAVSRLDGVVAVSPEVIIPCAVRGQPAFLRGIVPDNFLKLNPLTILDGRMFGEQDLNSAIVGVRLAKKLNIKVGDKVLVTGVLVDACLELKVEGIFYSNSPADDEIVAPLHVGQWLRGLDYNQVTLIRAKVDRRLVSKTSIYEAIAREALEPTQPSGGGRKPSQPTIVSWTRISFHAEDIGVEEAQRFMEGYMERYGVTRESIITLSTIIFLLSSTTIAFSTRTLIVQHERELEVLRSIGSSKKLLKKDMIIKLLPITLASSIAGIAATIVFLNTIIGQGYLQILSHTLTFQPDPTVIALTIIFSIALVTASVLKQKL